MIDFKKFIQRLDDCIANWFGPDNLSERLKELTQRDKEREEEKEIRRKKHKE